MENNSDTNQYWTVCLTCQGEGRTFRRPSQKRQTLFRAALEEFTVGEGVEPAPLTGNMDVCPECTGSGLRHTPSAVPTDSNKYPLVAIIGGGIGGVALAIACSCRGIPFILFERDERFDARSQGYGLTLQQASKAVAGLGITSLTDGVISTRHVVHTPDGKVIGEWGLRRWKRTFIEKTDRRRNIHIARQTLRQQLLQQLGTPESIKWGHTLIEYSKNTTGTIDLTFHVGDKKETFQADVVVGADGIRSRVRSLAIGDEIAPLKYLDCIVMLGICPLTALDDASSPLLDSATVFQTVNGHDRMYMMPYDKDTIMWQFSFPLSESDAKVVSAQGPAAMKAEAYRRVQSWHSPVPEVVAATLDSNITGYPVYDRELFDPQLLTDKGNVTLLGDATHPMSPFKGQGANQALLDALALARKIFAVCNQNEDWKEVGIRKSILEPFEAEMAKRSAIKVESSAVAAKLLHSPAVLHDGDEPRGQRLGDSV